MLSKTLLYLYPNPIWTSKIFWYFLKKLYPNKSNSIVTPVLYFFGEIFGKFGLFRLNGDDSNAYSPINILSQLSK